MTRYIDTNGNATVTRRASKRLYRTNSPRLLDVLTLCAAGYTTTQIGRKLHVNENTVKSRLRALYKQLGAVDRAHAVAIGYQSGILPLGTHHAQTVRRELAARHALGCALLTIRECNCEVSA